MATEILRPTKAELGLATDTFYPKTADKESLHILINEEVADDDSTWIRVTGGGLSRLDIKFDSLTLRKNYTKIVECNVFSRVQISDIASTVKLTVLSTLIDSDGIVTDYMGVGTEQSKSLASTDWQTITCSFSGSDIISAIEKYLQNINASGIEKASPFGVRLACSMPSGGNNKRDFTLTISQVYAEIVYSDDSGDTTTETFYLKENGNWVGYSNISLYRKDNGTWTITDATVFESGGNYIIQREAN